MTPTNKLKNARKRSITTEDSKEPAVEASTAATGAEGSSSLVSSLTSIDSEVLTGTVKFAPLKSVRKKFKAKKELQAVATDVKPAEHLYVTSVEAMKKHMPLPNMFEEIAAKPDSIHLSYQRIGKLGVSNQYSITIDDKAIFTLSGVLWDHDMMIKKEVRSFLAFSWPSSACC